MSVIKSERVHGFTKEMKGSAEIVHNSFQSKLLTFEVEILRSRRAAYKSDTCF